MKKKMLVNKDASVSKFLLFGLLGLIMCFVFVSCENYQIQSQWRDKDIVVDGESGDWLDALTYVEEFNISVGMANDTDFLYIGVAVENPLVRMRVMRQGLTVWFDPEGGRKKTLGIRFPLGSLGRGGPPAEFEENLDMEKFQRALPLALNELEILGPNREDVRRIKKDEAEGVNVALGVSSDRLVYELKIPLMNKNNPDLPYAINVRPGSSFGIGIETSSQRRDMEKTPRSNTTRGMGRPQGGGNSGMGRPGSMGGMPGAGRMMMPRKLRLWMSVLLSQERSPF
ncbi:hypothetical protein ACFLQZ_02730 [Acidobacteriota bacterium]